MKKPFANSLAARIERVLLWEAAVYEPRDLAADLPLWHIEGAFDAEAVAKESHGHDSGPGISRCGCPRESAVHQEGERTVHAALERSFESGVH